MATKLKEMADSVPPLTPGEDDTTALDSLHEAQAEDVELIREIAGTQMSLREQLKQSLIDTGFELDIGGVHIYDWKESGWAIPLVLLYNAVFLLSFFYFCYTLTLAAEAQEYLSLSGTDFTQTCASVPLQITARFEGDVYGNWNTAGNFKQNASIFTLDFLGTSVTIDQY